MVYMLLIFFGVVLSSRLSLLCIFNMQFVLFNFIGVVDEHVSHSLPSLNKWDWLEGI